MVVICKYPRCGRAKIPGGVSFHRFPANVERCKQWIQACGLDWMLAQGQEVAAVSKNFYLCGQHFPQHCFKISKQRHVLVKDALPITCPVYMHEGPGMARTIACSSGLAPSGLVNNTLSISMCVEGGVSYACIPINPTVNIPDTQNPSSVDRVGTVTCQTDLGVGILPTWNTAVEEVRCNDVILLTGKTLPDSLSSANDNSNSSINSTCIQSTLPSKMKASFVNVNQSSTSTTFCKVSACSSINSKNLPPLARAIEVENLVLLNNFHKTNSLLNADKIPCKAGLGQCLCGECVVQATKAMSPNVIVECADVDDNSDSEYESDVCGDECEDECDLLTQGDGARQNDCSVTMNECPKFNAPSVKGHNSLEFASSSKMGQKAAASPCNIMLDASNSFSSYLVQIPTFTTSTPFVRQGNTLGSVDASLSLDDKVDAEECFKKPQVLNTPSKMPKLVAQQKRCYSQPMIVSPCKLPQTETPSKPANTPTNTPSKLPLPVASPRQFGSPCQPMVTSPWLPRPQYSPRHQKLPCTPHNTPTKLPLPVASPRRLGSPRQPMATSPWLPRPQYSPRHQKLPCTPHNTPTKLPLPVASPRQFGSPSQPMVTSPSMLPRPQYSPRHHIIPCTPHNTPTKLPLPVASPRQFGSPRQPMATSPWLPRPQYSPRHQKLPCTPHNTPTKLPLPVASPRQFSSPKVLLDVTNTSNNNNNVKKKYKGKENLPNASSFRKNKAKLHSEHRNSKIPILVKSPSNSYCPVNKLVKNAETISNVKNFLIQSLEATKVNTKNVAELKRIRVQRSKLRKTVLNLKNRNITPKEAKKLAMAYMKDTLTSTQYSFFAGQVNNAGKKPQGRRYTNEEKILGLNIYYKNPSTYRFLAGIFNLPGKDTLKNFLMMHPSTEGFNEFVFRALKVAVKKMKKLMNLCYLVLDEVNLRPEIIYNANNGNIDGLDLHSKQPATHAMVFMLRSMFGKWKQPIAYFFAQSQMKSDRLGPLVREAIERVEEVGFDVRGIIGDQSGPNQKLYATQLGATVEKPYFNLKNKKIYCFFDPPHLLKSVRNNLKAHNMYISKKTVIKWSYIRQFYESDVLRAIRLAPKLTQTHIHGNSTTNMRVYYAAQALSRTVAAGIYLYGTVGKFSADSVYTAEFLEVMDNLFDSFNGVTKTPYKGKPYKIGISDTSPHFELWKKVSELFANCQFTRFVKKTQKWVFYRPPCLKGWQQTMCAAELLWFDLRAMGIDFFPIGRLNQDCLENFFSQVRLRGGNNKSISAVEFSRIYKTLLMTSILTPPGNNTNCMMDSDSFLQIFRPEKLPESPINSDNQQEARTSDSSKTSLEDESIADVFGTNSFSEIVEEEQAEENPGPSVDTYEIGDADLAADGSLTLQGINNYAGYVAKRIVRQKNLQCTSCEKSVVSDEERGPEHMFMNFREFQDDKECLTTASKDAVIAVDKSVKLIGDVMKKDYSNRKLKIVMQQKISDSIDLIWLKRGCPTHFDRNFDLFTTVIITSFVRALCKRQNQEIAKEEASLKRKRKVEDLARSTKRRLEF